MILGTLKSCFLFYIYLIHKQLTPSDVNEKCDPIAEEPSAMLYLTVTAPATSLACLLHLSNTSIETTIPNYSSSIASVEMVFQHLAIYTLNYATMNMIGRAISILV